MLYPYFSEGRMVWSYSWQLEVCESTENPSSLLIQLSVFTLSNLLAHPLSFCLPAEHLSGNVQGAVGDMVQMSEEVPR